MKHIAFLKPTFTVIFLGGILFIIASFVAFISFFFLYDLNIDSAIKDGKNVVQPVIIALDKYKEDNDHYPDKLKDLVSSGYLKEIPKLNKGIGYYLSTEGSYAIWFNVDPMFFYQCAIILPHKNG